MEKREIIQRIAQSTGINVKNVDQTLALLQEGATIPFIARYRKEVTGNLDEVQIQDIQKAFKKLEELLSRKETILKSIEEQGKLTDELRNRISSCYDGNELEDIYLPYKKKRKTRGDMAREKGLLPLAEYIFNQKENNPYTFASKFITEAVTSADEAITGAQDIIAEWVNETEEVRDRLRMMFRKNGVIRSKVEKAKEQEATVYKDYFAFEETLHKCPSHRYLAMMRGDRDGLLRVILDIDSEEAIYFIKKKFITSQGECASIIGEAISDSYQRLLLPSLENQIRNEYKEKADTEAVKVFSDNARQLLLAPPLGQKNIIGLDPGYRTGCKVVCISSTGDLLYETVIYPHEPQRQWTESKDKISSLVDKYDVNAIAIGNGTASRETKELVDEISFSTPVSVFVVSENGASIYSASDVAREEFPDKDVTVRGAVSIARRLMDPLAELVKIDPKSIGVGQYQHDVDQTMLKENLDNTVMSCVNSVGININTASKHLLAYVAGIGPTLSQNIVDYRKEYGHFASRSQLLKVPRLGPKVYEQCAGFLRIRDAENVLDNTGVHPESYEIVYKMAKDMGVKVDQLISDAKLRSSIKLQSYITDKVGMPTLQDILKELAKPGLDPRGEAKAFSFAEGVKTMNDVREGMVLPGLVTNLTNFGAFVDIGIKQDALLHISQITRKFIKSPSEVLKLGQELEVKILGIDEQRKRVNLTLLN
jgi:protein Tex